MPHFPFILGLKALRKCQASSKAMRGAQVYQVGGWLGSASSPQTKLTCPFSAAIILGLVCSVSRNYKRAARGRLPPYRAKSEGMISAHSRAQAPFGLEGTRQIGLGYVFFHLSRYILRLFVYRSYPRRALVTGAIERRNISAQKHFGCGVRKAKALAC